jgi:hypothetical protein
VGNTRVNGSGKLPRWIGFRSSNLEAEILYFMRLTIFAQGPWIVSFALITLATHLTRERYLSPPPSTLFTLLNSLHSIIVVSLFRLLLRWPTGSNNQTLCKVDVTFSALGGSYSEDPAGFRNLLFGIWIHKIRGVGLDQQTREAWRPPPEDPRHPRHFYLVSNQLDEGGN